jgi:hypothetical protein
MVIKIVAYRRGLLLIILDESSIWVNIKPCRVSFSLLITSAVFGRYVGMGFLLQGKEILC